MNMNNPASRLHTILTSIKKLHSDPVDTAFAKVLNVDQENYPLLMKRIGMVFVLMDAIDHAVKSIKGLNHDKYLLPVREISEKMRGMNFSKPVVHSTINQIDERMMAYLDMTAEYLSKHLPEPTISEASRQKILDEILGLWDEVKALPNIPEDLRQFIFDKLDLLRQTVEIYDISGANPFKEATESIVGGVFFKAHTYKDDEKSTQILDKLFKCALTAYCSIEVVNNMAVLPESIKTIAVFLGGGS